MNVCSLAGLDGHAYAIQTKAEIDELVSDRLSSQIPTTRVVIYRDTTVVAHVCYVCDKQMSVDICKIQNKTRLF